MSMFQVYKMYISCSAKRQITGILLICSWRNVKNAGLMLGQRRDIYSVSDGEVLSKRKRSCSMITH